MKAVWISTLFVTAFGFITCIVKDDSLQVTFGSNVTEKQWE